MPAVMFSVLHLIQDFEDASCCKYARVLNMFNMHGLHEALNMSGYGSVWHNNASICCNFPQYA